MNILFLIGNGFDLNLGLRTRYNDFYEYYQAVESKSDSINKLKKNIFKNFENWSDLELALGKYTKHINSIEEFDEVFEDIGDKLADYLKQEENGFDFNKIDGKKIYDYLSFPEHSLLKADENELISFHNKWSNYDWNVYVITFNYTQTIEKLVGEKHKNIQIGIHDKSVIVLKGIEHIHGYTNERMIMGVNDVSQISNTTFHENQDVLDAFVKNNCNKAHKHTIDELCKQQISSANLICVFGSSIGDTDNLWWNLIGEQLKQDCKLIIFNKSEDISPNRDYKKLRKERKMKDSFLEKIKLSEEEKKMIVHNIYIGINTDMFKMF
jgi:hypothetical protein